jgi:hypothetical protein
MLSVEVQTLALLITQQLVTGPFTEIIKQQLGSFNTFTSLLCQYLSFADDSCIQVLVLQEADYTIAIGSSPYYHCLYTTEQSMGPIP